MNDRGDSTVFATLAKYIGGKLVSAVLIVAALLTCYYFYKNPDKLHDLWNTTKAAVVWLGFAAVLPWALFFIPPVIIRTESNAAAASMLVGYLIVDVVAALWLAEWSIEGVLAWGVVVLGFLLAAVYNFLVCDFLAEQAEDSL